MTSMLSSDAGSSMAPRTLPPSMIERITLIMDLFERPHTRRTLEQVCRCTGLPRSTAYRILEQLVRMRWLDRTDIGYRLGSRSLGLGGRDVGHSPLRVAAAPVLQELALRTELVVHLAVLDGPDIYYLDKVGGRSAVEVPSRVGGRVPAHCTALGKAMLAWVPPEHVEAQLGGMLLRCTARSIGDFAVLHRELSRIRAGHGLTFERGECFSGIGCVSMAVRNTDGPVGALSVVGAADAALERVAPLVVEATRTVADALYGEPPRRTERRYAAS
ncbi:IclR family transcriptional regulator [Nocardia sp. alder85J]|uniref:IclR family transcriptional regulator n=1 Tax=Nocardia sp. alder85J TaxID=2862949 RepID=UPI001CD60E7E|nr:IclR family transcriptional regulator [Nocardia sp. alder85J]MCX4095510.1 IclR family transcriptional regulator [Nocardia sp. alder85J]